MTRVDLVGHKFHGSFQAMQTLISIIPQGKAHAGKKDVKGKTKQFSLESTRKSTVRKQDTVDIESTREVQFLQL